MKFKIIFVLFFGILAVSCKSVPKKQDSIPSVTTISVIEKLSDTKQALKEAGLNNTQVGTSIDKALTLAERLNILLEKIEKEQKKYEDKIVILPEK